MTYKITYKITGLSKFDHVIIRTNEHIKLKNGKEVVPHNIMDVIEVFELLAAGWGTYETKNAIRDITVISED